MGAMIAVSTPFYVDDRDGKNIIHIFQFKYVNEFGKVKNNFPSNEIDKVLSVLADILSKKDTLQSEVNPLLWNKITEIWAAFEKPTTPTIEVHFCGNMAPLVRGERERLVGALRPYRYIDFHEHTIDTIPERLIERKTRRVDRTIRFVDNQYFERVDGNIRGVIATIEAGELVKMIEDPDSPGSVLPDIFDDNVTIYLGSKNRINRSIMDSALSESNALFWYLNNGLTITCETLDYMPRARSPNINLQNVQIVNGGQTSNALFEAWKQDPERVKDVLLLARIYETRQQNITSEVAESTNSQTPVKSRDLHSNDIVQKKLEESLADLGFFYERKARQHANQPGERRIDALAAGQAYLAFYDNQPEVAKKDRARVFGDLYDNIFNDEITAHRILTPFLTLRQIEIRKHNVQRCVRTQEPYDLHEFYCVEGTHHVLNIVSVLCDQLELNEITFETCATLIDHAIAVVGQTVAEQIKQDTLFSASKYFKDGRTKGLLQAAARKYDIRARLVEAAPSPTNLDFVHSSVAK
jgi:hypothetical protein